MDSSQERRWLYNEGGVYSFSCDETGRIYIGAATKVYERWLRHMRDLRRGMHYCQKMQSDWDWYGIGSFSFTLLEMLPNAVFDFELLDPMENKWLQLYKPLGCLYNKYPLK